MQLTVYYFLVQSCIFLAVCSRSVEIDHRQALEDVLSRNMLNKNNLSLTISSQNDSNEDIDSHSVLPRIKRHSCPCEIRRVRKWNHCLEKHFTEAHCRKYSVACLSPNNIPPKCKKNYIFIFGKNGGCRVLTSCTCAA
ncbi:hypothetical protein OS493_021871 [Desmophyllum pertusum]|uniref:GDNF/GAS1 domain-containing protein n=1 Tax=Desmophyllum pertusum TaxID=174260 RepID=A0A9W9ZMW0_9CNID|nr:hypothetical protein OS493_021871 [Desmophyllum pertusum]